MNVNPKVSILVPVYNAGKYLCRCLDSIVNQTLKEIEIILVDDGSTDNSAKLIKEYAYRDSRIRIFTHPENKGTVCARTSAVNLATGKYSMFMDNDDCLELYAAEKLYNILNKDEDLDILGFDITGVPAKENYDKLSRAVGLWSNNNNNLSIDGEDILKTFLIDIKPICFLWSKIYKTELLKKAFSCLKPIKAVLAEDWYIYTSIAYFARKYRYVKLPLYHYYCGTGTSTFRKVTLEFFESRIKSFEVIKAIRDFLDEHGVLEGDENIFYNLEKRLIADQFTHMRMDLYPEDQQTYIKNLSHSEHSEYVINYLLKLQEFSIESERIINSIYWKMTKPLQWVIRFFRIILIDYSPKELFIRTKDLFAKEGFKGAIRKIIKNIRTSKKQFFK